MGNCVSSCRRQRQPKKLLTLALLGIDDAGKTTASCSFAGEPIDQDAAPTIGFRSVKFTFEQYDITLYDVGGGKNIRPVWKNYFPEVYGFIYLVDASSTDRIDEARETFRDTLEHPHVSGKPLLLLANKQDKPDALDEMDLCEELNLESVVNMNKCPCRIDTCTAIQGTGRKMDQHMKEGLRWLLNTIDSQWEDLNDRVQADMRAAEEVRKVENAARRERVRKQREEREKREEEERQRLGITKRDSEDEEEMLGADPFKPLDLNELKKKEETLKAEKKRLKELQTSLNAQDAQRDSLFTHGSRSPHLDNGNVMDTSSGHFLNGDSPFSGRNQRMVLPPLEPLGTPFMENSSHTKKKKKKKFPSSVQPASEEEIVRSRSNTVEDDDSVAGIAESPSSNKHLSHRKSTMTLSNIDVTSSYEDLYSLERNRRGITQVAPSLDGSDGGGDAYTPRTRRIKKKKLRDLGARRRNRQTEVSGSYEDGELSARPSPHLRSLDGGDIEDHAESSRGMAGEEKRKRIFMVNGNERPGGHGKYELSPRRVLNRESVSGDSSLPRHSQVHSTISETLSLGSRNWGMAEDLPTVADDVIAHRPQPNFNHDDDFLL